MHRKIVGLLIVLCITFSVVQAGEFKLTSTSFDKVLTNQQVYDGFGCTGKNLSPVLKWTGAPEGTKSFAITVYDPDAPTGSGWWHWVLYNIPADVTELAEDAGNISGKNLPESAVQGRTDFGTRAFGGPCPPQGDKPHRYIFTVFALRVENIEVDTESTAALIGYMLNANALAKAGFTATYGR